MAENLPVEEPLGLRVTAILIALNQIEPLRRAVAALEKSTERERLEILVVDLGSQDGCAQIDTEFPAVVMLRLPHNFGATKAINISTGRPRRTCCSICRPMSRSRRTQS